jgi:Rad3-related DNA helicase
MTNGFTKKFVSTLIRRNILQHLATSDHLVQILPAPTKDTATGIMAFFPWHKYKKALPNQIEALQVLEAQNASIILQAPTGSGKTATGYAFLKWRESQTKEGGCYYIVPNKTLVNQIKEMYPDVGVAYGRNEHECLYYEDRPRADAIPCSLLVDCPHRVDQETGVTQEEGADPCPYLNQKYEFRKGRVGVCTMSFYLYTGPAFSADPNPPAALVIDEVHNLPDVIRRSLSYTISDNHLEQAIITLREIGGADQEADILDKFYRAIIKIVKRKVVKVTQAPGFDRIGRVVSALLEDHEIEELIRIVGGINSKELKKKISAAIKAQKINTIERREILKRIETLARDLQRYLRSLEYSLPSEQRKATNYTYAYYMREPADDGSEKLQYRLVIQAYTVAPLIKRMLSSHTLSMSATIGDPKVFGYESGITSAFYSLASEFPAENTRIFIPDDTPNLSVKSRKKGEPNRVMRKMAQTCKRFNQAGHRCLVVVVSNLERKKFCSLCEEEGVHAISYGNGLKPKEAAEKFKDGEGDVLVGTSANYSEGVDLHDQSAPIIMVLRPSYASPDDPLTQFEDRRFSGGHAWALRNWRVMEEALQVRGRNIRSKKCVGVTIFISQQFRRFVYHCLPEYLKPSYRSEISLEQCVKETLKLLKDK